MSSLGPILEKIGQQRAIDRARSAGHDPNALHKKPRPPDFWGPHPPNLLRVALCCLVVFIIFATAIVLALVGKDLKHVAGVAPVETAKAAPIGRPVGAPNHNTGAVTLKGLPPGTYRLRIRDERPGRLEREMTVEIKPHETTELKLSVPANKQ
jgi:hypothetical protein